MREAGTGGVPVPASASPPPGAAGGGVWTNAASRVPAAALLWGLFFIIGLGLGYPTLNRYDPRSTPGLIDAADYFAMASGHPEGVEGHRRFRILVPALAAPLHRALEGRTGTWSALSLAFLLVTSALTASSAVLVAGAGRIVSGRAEVGLVAALLLLLCFVTPNSLLAGSVDSAELLAFAAVIRALLVKGVWLLPLIGIPAVAAKETFLPLAAVFVGAWLFLAGGEAADRKRGWVAWTLLCAAGAATLGLVRLAVAGSFTWPWQVAAGLKRHGGFAGSLWTCLSDRAVPYLFVWLLPLGAVRLSRVGVPWAGASVAAAAAALLLGAWAAAEGNAARGVFSVLGPALAVGTAWLLLPERAGGAGSSGKAVRGGRP